VHRPLALVLLLAASRAVAAVFLVATVEDAARTSDAVVRGRVERHASRLGEGGRIVTDVELAVTSAWKGQPGARVTVTIPGGQVGDRGAWVDAAPVFEDGEEVVVFLARRPAGWGVNGLALGKLRVAGRTALPGVDRADVREAPVRAGEARLDEPLSVEELERRVRAAR